MPNRKSFLSNLFGKKNAEDSADTASEALLEHQSPEEATEGTAIKLVEVEDRSPVVDSNQSGTELNHQIREPESEERLKLADQARQYAQEAEAHKAELEAKRIAVEEAARKAVIATHIVTREDTLSGIALRYYGHATPPYYKLIYEFNKEAIGPNMNVIVPGQVLQIPALPEELK